MSECPMPIYETANDRVRFWRPIDTAPAGEVVLLWQPATYGSRGDLQNPARMVVERWPTHYPRKSTHWMPLPDPPESP